MEANASNKSEAPKPIYTMQRIQNGRIVEFDGCIFIIVFLYRKAFRDTFVPVVRKLIRISVPMFWLGSCPTNFSKTIGNLNSDFASHKCRTDHLHGNAFNVSIHRGDKQLSRQSNLRCTTSEFCNQLEEVCFDTSAEDFKDWKSTQSTKKYLGENT